MTTMKPAETTIYYHVLTVCVLSRECSSDAVERLIEALATREVQIRAATFPLNRSRCPAVRIGPEPESPFAGPLAQQPPSRQAIEAYHAAMDAWMDTWPTWEQADAL